MERQTVFQSSTYEQRVIGIMRRLPLERALQLVDFARFLESELTKKNDGWVDKEKAETGEGICASEEKWDKSFAKPEAKCVMRKMAREALEDYRAGRTTDIAITKDGRLAPV
ncbi:MAG: hypothetical protein QME81_14190 [bacterium]|nr:hypothetical protein [bacterium]